MKVVRLGTGLSMGIASLLLCCPVFAQNAGSDPPGEGLLEDAAAYSARFGVGVDEAVRRLRLQGVIGELEEALAGEERATFAGLWVEHQPQYRVVVRFTDRAAEARLEERVAGGPLAGRIGFHPARWSLAELERQQEESHRQGKRTGVAFDSDIDLRENRVEMHVLEPPALAAALERARARLPEAVRVVRVERLARPAAVLTGGGIIAGCTGGFTVQAPNDEVGLSTAAHCPDNQYYQGVFLPLRKADFEGDQDVQWNTACDRFDVTNHFESGLGLRSCVATKSRSQQFKGEWVCKYGRTTGRTCGEIDSKSHSPSYVQNANSTFIRVRGGAGLSANGDSGGPWYVDGTAYGITSGHTAAGEALYMAINYIGSIGVKVLTAPPGPGCNIAPAPAFTWTQRINGNVLFDALSSVDSDGTIVRYDWDFGDGFTAASTTPTISHAYPIQNSTYFVTLTVTDNEGKSRSAFRDVALCFPISCGPQQ